MRHTIETAPRDGKVIILEDDASGTYDVGHWSPEAREWVGENGEPKKITPTHWHPMLRDRYLLQEDRRSSNPSQVGRARRRLAASSITATLIAAALIGLYFRPEVAAHVTRYAGQLAGVSMNDEQVVAQGTQLPSQDSKTALPAPRQTEANQASVPVEAQEAPQIQQVAVASVPEARQSLKEERAEAMAQEPTETPRAIEGLDVQLQMEAAKSARSLEQERDKTTALAEAAAARQELTAGTAQHRQALDEERARSAALASELATAQREIETQAAQLRKAGDETVQIKQTEAAKSAQSLEQERQKTVALAQEAAAARQELTASTAQHRQAHDEERVRAAALASELATARREIEIRAALLRNASDETRQLKQATESAMAELRQSLHQERDKTEAMARDLESTRRTVGARVTPEPAASSPTSKAVPAVEVAAVARPAAVEAQGNPEATRLIARASALLGKGDIGAARIVLEHAAEAGSAQASFMLAETYDPAILSAWGTYGTRGEATKAREFYAKAHAGGIQEAKDRFNALR
jgi:hypothetical protein